MFAGKIRDIDQAIAATQIEIQQEREDIDDLKNNFQLEIAERLQRDANMNSFIAELKMWVFEIAYFPICKTS